VWKSFDIFSRKGEARKIDSEIRATSADNTRCFVGYSDQVSINCSNYSVLVRFLGLLLRLKNLVKKPQTWAALATFSTIPEEMYAVSVSMHMKINRLLMNNC
jgi:hypothetical protein